MAHVSSSGIQAFGSWKLKGGSKFIQYELSKGGEINVTKYGPSNMEWNEFVSELPKDHPCYVFYHFKYSTKKGGQRSKLCMIQWIPTESSPKDKMSYAMWSNNVKHAFDGIHCIVQACSLSDLAHEEVLLKVTKFEKDEL